MERQEMHLFLVRHGITEWNLTGRPQGQTDIDLCEEGWKQAAYCAKALADVRLDQILTSPLIRAVHTAEAIAGYHPACTIQVEAGLIERNYGRYEGLLQAEIERLKQSGVDMQAEPPEMVAARACACVFDLWKQYAGKRVLAVTHGGLIKALLASSKPEQKETFFLDNVFVTYLRVAEAELHTVVRNCNPEDFAAQYA